MHQLEQYQRNIASNRSTHNISNLTHTPHKSEQDCSYENEAKFYAERTNNPLTTATTMSGPWFQTIGIGYINQFVGPGGCPHEFSFSIPFDFQLSVVTQHIFTDNKLELFKTNTITRYSPYAVTETIWPNLKWIYGYVKTNMDTRPDFKPTRNN